MNLVGGVVLVFVLAVFSLWLLTRAARAKRAFVKWPGMIVAGLLALLLIAVGGAALLGRYRLSIAHDIAVSNLKAAQTPALRERGERLANLCAACHSSTGKPPLDGGTENFLDGLGTLYPPNLTPAGHLPTMSDGEVARAIRRGVDKEGRALLIMPAENFRALSDDDVQALLSYLRSQPTITHQTPARSLNLLGAALVGAGLFPTAVQPTLDTPVTAPPKGPTPDYGRYLVDISGCRTCHGVSLTGGTSSFVPVGPDLREAVPSWSPAQFVATIRTGRSPHGRPLDPAEMPWKNLSAAYQDMELEAIYTYIISLSSKAEATQDKPTLSSGGSQN